MAVLTRSFTFEKIFEAFKKTNIELTFFEIDRDSLPGELFRKLEEEGHNAVFNRETDNKYPNYFKTAYKRLC